MATFLYCSTHLRIVLIVLLTIWLSACQNLSSPIKSKGNQTYWDFDHQVQFKEVQLTNNRYQLEVMNKKVNFERIATFLLRRAKTICQGYGYRIEVLQGVESYDHKRASPNLIVPNLKAQLECSTHQLYQ